MKSEFIQCELCKKEILLESCELAACRTVIDGEECVFCCKTCAQSYQQEKKE